MSARFGEPWITQVPPGWTTLPFKRVARVREGQVDPSADRYRDLPLYAPNHVASGTGQLLSIETAAQQGADSGKYLVKQGDIVYSKIRPALRKVIVAPLDGLCSADMYAIWCRPNTLPRYLFWSMLSDSFSEAAILESDRVAMPKVNRETLADFPIAVPPLPAQRAIADFLDRKTAAIDALIEKKERLIALLAEKRAALIHQAVTKGLDPNVPMKDSGVPWIGDIPAHWTIKRLKHISPQQTVGVVVNPSTYVAANGTIPFIYGSDVSEGHIDVSQCRRVSATSNQQLSKSKLRTGDLVSVRVGDPGVTSVVPENLDGINCASMMIIRKQPSFHSKWLEYAMNSPVGKTNVTLVAYGAAQKQFNISHAVDFIYPVPPLDEQRAIASQLAEHDQRFASIRGQLSEQIAKLKEYRQSLITAAVTGQLRIPAEEPPS